MAIFTRKGSHYFLWVDNALDGEGDLAFTTDDGRFIDRESAIRLIAHLQKVFQIPVIGEKTTRAYIPEGVTQVRNVVTGEVKQVTKGVVEDENR